MRRINAIGIAGMLIMANAFADDPEALVAGSRDAVRSFATSLKSALMQALEAGGPVNAIGVCKVVAPEIAGEVSREHGLTVARTSLRVRNPRNAPDAWEREVLQQFIESNAAGADPARLEHHEVTGEGAQRRFRYMKAIPTAQLCLTCHGTELEPAVRETLSREYPEDEATGFRTGDIRGAFTITAPM